MTKTFEEVKKQFLESIYGAGLSSTGISTSGQTRVVGKKDGEVITRTPSASKYEVKEDDDPYIQALDFLLDVDPDIISDDLEVKVYQHLVDFTSYNEEINEARFNKRTPAGVKTYMRKYYKAHKNQILNKIKRNKKRVKGIVHDIKKKKMAKYGQRADGTRQKKNTIRSKGDNRRVK